MEKRIYELGKLFIGASIYVLNQVGVMREAVCSSSFKLLSLILS